MIQSTALSGSNRSLLRAAANGHEETVKLLLETDKVDVGLNDKSGVTPLSLAARNGHGIIAKLLSDADMVRSRDQHAFAPFSCEVSKGEWW